MPNMFEDNVGIAVITSLFHPYYGGAEKQLERLTKTLSSQRVKCCVVTRRLNDLKPFECLHDVPVYRVFATRISSGLLSTLTFIVSICSFFIAHPNITRRVQILQANSDSPGLIAVILGTLFRKKIIVRMRGTRELEGIKASFLIKTFFKVISRTSDAIVTQYDQFHHLKSLGVDDLKIYIIPNGVDTEYFKKSSLEIKERFRKKMGFENSIIGLYVGRLDPVKGLDILMEALPSVIKKHPQFRMIIIGSGPYEDYLKNLAENLRVDEHILFVGAVQDVKIYYEIADVFILPSRSEGISNALLEAMSMELAVTATAVGGTPEIIKNLDNGCLVTPSPDAIAEKVQLLISNIDLRDRLGKAARKTIKQNYSFDRIIKIYLSLYANVIQKR